jgi:predicted RNA binding protein YcfA (HicA-like mRNA interferase family)
MPKLKNLSYKDLVKIFSKLGFVVASQKGSHVKLVRIIDNNKQVMIIPAHKELDKGTLLAIFRQSSRYVPEDKLKDYFYV